MQSRIITFQPIPFGKAATNRVLYYARGFTNQGITTKIHILRPSDYGTVRNYRTHGKYKDIEYIYTSGSTVFSNKIFHERSFRKQFYKIRRYFLTILGICVSTYLIIKERHEITFIFIYLEEHPFILAYYIMLSRIIKTKIHIDISELPYFTKQNKSISWFFKQYLNVYIKYILGNFDRLSVISSMLKDYFISHGIKTEKLISIPIMFDREEFQKKITPELPIENTLLFVGDMSQQKDGFLTMLHAFKKISVLKPKFILKIIGESPVKNRVKNYIDNYIITYSLANRIKHLGYLGREDFIQNLLSSRIILLPKPDDLQSNYCMPSKLAELLASGRPVITSKISDIQHYLENGKSIIFFDPKDDNGLYEAILTLENNPSQNAIGSAGKQVAFQKFHYADLIAKNLKHFIN
jgi:glycosyltransferase involved in cell wall biosynthesis